jgi:hypothetical protein
MSYARRPTLVLTTGAVTAVALLAAACGGGDRAQTTTPAPKMPPALATLSATAATATPSAVAPEQGAANVTELADDLRQLKSILRQAISYAQADDEESTQDVLQQVYDPIEVIIEAARTVDAATADSIEQRELDIEDEASSDSPDLTLIAAAAQAILPLLDLVAARLQISP